MILRYDGQQARRLKMALVADNVYCIVSEPLKKLHPGKTPLNSVEIWMAAHGLTCDLIKSPAPELIFDDLVEELKEEVTQDSVFLILMVSMCQISALREKIKNADVLLKLLMNVCHQHEMYFKMLEQFDGMEISMRATGKKVDLLNYEMQAAGDNKAEIRKVLETFAQAAIKLGPQNIESNLLALNKINLENGHIYDDLILDMYEQREKMLTPKPGIEVTMGNKNVAESGSNQLNTGMPQSLAGYQELLKLLGNGGR